MASLLVITPGPAAADSTWVVRGPAATVDGVAFRYVLPHDLGAVLDEASSFMFPTGAPAAEVGVEEEADGRVDRAQSDGTVGFVVEGDGSVLARTGLDHSSWGDARLRCANS